MANAKEPMLLLDLTGSMNYGVTRLNPTPRHTVLHDAVKIFVQKLSEADTAGEDEEGGGGVRTIGFAHTPRNPQGYVDLEDLNPNNFESHWSQLRFNGSTHIRPGFEQILTVYNGEFGQEDPPPDIALVIATDGVLEDQGWFEDKLGHLPANMSVEIVVVGDGDDNTGVVHEYQSIAARSGDKVHVTSAVGTVDANQLAGHLLQAVS